MNEYKRVNKRRDSVKIGIVGMHEMPEILSDNLKRADYDAEYLSGGVKNLLKNHRKFNILIVIFPFHRLKLILLAKLLGLKVIVMWIGTDCLMVRKNPHKWWMKALLPFINRHIADAPHLVEELREVGLSSIFIPIIPKLMRTKPLPMPDEFKVLTYIMPDRPEFYGATIIGEVARRLPDVEFIITEEGKVPNPPSNINHLGLVSLSEMERLYKETSVFLRLTAHDGISKSVLEALAFGRYVIRAIDFPGCVKARTAVEVVEILNSLRDIKEPNREGVDFIKSELNENRIAEKWREVFNRI